MKLGAGRADGLDTDHAAVEATAANAERNAIGNRVSARLGTLAATASDRYDLVLANLVAAILVELAPRLEAHMTATGVLLASGIIAPRADEVVAALLVRSGWSPRQRLRADGDWVSLRLERPT